MKQINRKREKRLIASATVEAVVVIPIYVYAVLSIMFYLQIIHVKYDMDRAAYNTLRTCAKYAYAYEQWQQEDKKISSAVLYAGLLQELGTDYAGKHYIVEDNAGIIVYGSKVLENDSQIQLNLNYIIKNPFDIFGLGVIRIEQRYVAEAWLGETKSHEWKSDSDSKRVYIASDSDVYHVKITCPTLKIQPETTTKENIGQLRNESGAQYYPCEFCAKGFDSNVCYYTPFGTRYHLKKDCGMITRTIMSVRLDSVGDRRCCLRCNEG